jgi:hypothetical protein
MGEMVVKSGDWQTAQKIYENAKHTKRVPQLEVPGGVG